MYDSSTVRKKWVTNRRQPVPQRVFVAMLKIKRGSFRISDDYETRGAWYVTLIVTGGSVQTYFEFGLQRDEWERLRKTVQHRTIRVKFGTNDLQLQINEDMEAEAVMLFTSGPIAVIVDEDVFHYLKTIVDGVFELANVETS